MVKQSNAKPTSKVKVSVIAISYNHEKFIRQAFDGFVSQKTDFEFEIVVGDDCSTDGTQKIIDEYIAKYPKLFRQISRSKNIGVQRNFAETMQSARGEYLALCECDDYWTDSLKLQKQADFLDKNPGYSMSFHPVKVIFEDKIHDDEIFPLPEFGNDLSTEKLLQQNFIQTNSVMYKRQDYRTLPINILPIDWYLHLFHAQFGKIGFTHNVMAVYRRHPNGIWWDSYNNAEQIWIKYGYNFLMLLHELMLLYGNSKANRKIINQHIAGTYEAISAIKPQDAADKVAVKSISAVPSETWDYMKDLIKQVQHLTLQADRYTEQKAHLQGSIENERQAKKMLSDELQNIKLSRLWKTLLVLRFGSYAVKHPINGVKRAVHHFNTGKRSQ